MMKSTLPKRIDLRVKRDGSSFQRKPWAMLQRFTMTDALLCPTSGRKKFWRRQLCSLTRSSSHTVTSKPWGWPKATMHFDSWARRGRSCDPVPPQPITWTTTGRCRIESGRTWTFSVVILGSHFGVIRYGVIMQNGSCPF
ncbi:hypothetical protein SDC9_173457 [bioreactor metagenome]|uniref:Uncharacterized protein n=1 Tax=bioreactor metagenome TaxID=1076179 RepID=A0A645GH70_9ZZZZ